MQRSKRAIELTCGWDRPLLTLIEPGFDCGSHGTQTSPPGDSRNSNSLAPLKASRSMPSVASECLPGVSYLPKPRGKELPGLRKRFRAGENNRPAPGDAPLSQQKFQCHSPRSVQVNPNGQASPTICALCPMCPLLHKLELHDSQEKPEAPC